MRADWNERAKEDAHYYVAFGRREQDDEEFFSTAADVVRDLDGEIRRFDPITPLNQRSALEIGCGPGRLMKPMAERFGEVHGVDVSDEMIARAKHNLRSVPNAFPHHASGSDLRRFADSSFDFVYSFAVFQHIPSADVVFSYLRETVRVLKPGGIARLQINGLPKTAKEYTTWSGVRISGDEIREFAAARRIDLLSLTGIDTQYMWTTWRKHTPAVIRSVSNAFSGESAVPASGRLACMTLWVENLPQGCELNSLEVRIGGGPGVVCYVGPAVNGLSQINVFLPKGVRMGLVPVNVEWRGRSLCADTYVRVIPPGPAVPRFTAISDGVNLLSGQLIESGHVKVVLEEVESMDGFGATVDGIDVENVESFRTDPLAERWEINFRLPAGTPSGGHVLDVFLGRRRVTRIGILTP